MLVGGSQLHAAVKIIAEMHAHGVEPYVEVGGLRNPTGSTTASREGGGLFGCLLRLNSNSSSFWRCDRGRGHYLISNQINSELHI